MGIQGVSDTTMTKVFVGGLAWETHKDALRDHFAQFGDILEAVIISDKSSGRSKGYGFVTFKDSHSAIKACQDPTPLINGRRANCNLASLGSRRLRSSPAPPPHPHPPPPPPLPPQGVRRVATGPWYYAPPGTYNQNHHLHGGVMPYYAASPAYGYSPPYITEYGYNPKLGNGEGSCVQGQFPHLPYTNQGGVFAPNTMLHMYPVYHFQHHQPHNVGLPAHIFVPPSPGGFATTIPAVISKLPAMPATSG
ncbi:hypothetical protein J5N97_013680 [Dioscorea zingiberensis]|uniref:RRM domain-containing protein n=1 Tax=Dioscorea zingiberensis TaxID=325984 RepID=A0A9D5CR95_9LILI|nr:hypothetical protein J5N97_013680 [Dioscorea zingiberensis]